MLFNDRNWDGNRGQIFKLAQDSDVSGVDVEDEVAQAEAFMKDTDNISRLSEYLGLNLLNFDVNDELEFYYDIERDGRKIGCIYKGWDDHRFKVSEIIPVKNIESFRANADKIFNIGATQGVAIGGEIVQNEFQLNLNINIYQGGLNASVLDESLKTLQFMVEKIKLFMN
ncbi:MAG: hypothetical protein V1701_07595 [Planctomycetota bacterium]